MALSLTIAGPVNAGQKKVAEKWLTGDLHQHTYFTDGSYPMNDLAREGVIASHAVSDPTGLYKKVYCPKDTASASIFRPTPSTAAFAQGWLWQ